MPNSVKWPTYSLVHLLLVFLSALPAVCTYFVNEFVYKLHQSTPLHIVLHKVGAVTALFTPIAQSSAGTQKCAQNMCGIGIMEDSK